MGKKIFHLYEKDREIFLSVLDTSKSSINSNAFIKIELENEHSDTLFKVMVNQYKDYSSVQKTIISLDGRKIINKIVEFPEAILEDIDKYYYYECLKYFKFQSDKFIFTYKILKKSDKSAKVLLIGIEKNVIERYNEVFEKLNLDVEYTINNFASIQGYDANKLKEDIILAEIHRDVNFTVYSEGQVLFVRSFEKNKEYKERTLEEIEKIKSYINLNYGDFAPAIYVFGENALELIKYCEKNTKQSIRISYFDIYDEKLYKTRFGIKKGIDFYPDQELIHLYHACNAVRSEKFDFVLPEDEEKIKEKEKSLFTKVSKYFIYINLIIFAFITLIRVVSKYMKLSNILEEETMYRKKISQMDTTHGEGFSTFAPALARKVFQLNRLSAKWKPNQFILTVLTTLNKNKFVKVNDYQVKNGSICLIKGTAKSENKIKLYIKKLSAIKGIKVSRFVFEKINNKIYFRAIVKFYRRIKWQ